MRGLPGVAEGINVLVKRLQFIIRARCSKNVGRDDQGASSSLPVGLPTPLAGFEMILARSSRSCPDFRLVSGRDRNTS